MSDTNNSQDPNNPDLLNTLVPVIWKLFGQRAEIEQLIALVNPIWEQLQPKLPQITKIVNDLATTIGPSLVK